MNNGDYIKNAFTPDELKYGCFRNWDGISKILTHSFILQMLKYIDFNKVGTILDVGSRDCCQSLEFNRWFPNANIYAFEPIPSNINWCKNVTKDIEKITIIPKAISSYNGKANFYEVTNGNIGASSLFKKTNHPWSRGWQQKEIEVDCIRLEDWLVSQNIDKVDLMWVDAQGAEKFVFQGIGKFLKDVDGIATEIELEALYENATMKDELDQILSDNFILSDLKNAHSAEADVIYINKKYLK